MQILETFRKSCTYIEMKSEIEVQYVPKLVQPPTLFEWLFSLTAKNR